MPKPDELITGIAALVETGQSSRMSLTVVTGGAVLTGRLAPEAVWRQRVAEVLTGSAQLNEFAAVFDTDTKRDGPPTHLHFHMARILQGTMGIPETGGMYRVAIEDVSAWTVGDFSYLTTEPRRPPARPTPPNTPHHRTPVPPTPRPVRRCADRPFVRAGAVARRYAPAGFGRPVGKTGGRTAAGRSAGAGQDAERAMPWRGPGLGRRGRRRGEGDATLDEVAQPDLVRVTGTVPHGGEPGQGDPAGAPAVRVADHEVTRASRGHQGQRHLDRHVVPHLGPGRPRGGIGARPAGVRPGRRQSCLLWRWSCVRNSCGGRPRGLPERL